MTVGELLERLAAYDASDVVVAVDCDGWPARVVGLSPNTVDGEAAVAIEVGTCFDVELAD